jgi:hypothetical protein
VFETTVRQLRRFKATHTGLPLRADPEFLQEEKFCSVMMNSGAHSRLTW